jgi:hypothetical protein
MKNNKVISIGDWIIKKYGIKVWENWANIGLCLEGDICWDKPSLLHRLLWKLHFWKPYIILQQKLGRY